MPVISTSSKVLSVLTLSALVIVVLSVNTIFPLPSARKSKSAFDILVLIKLSSISIMLGGIINSFNTKSCAILTFTTCAFATLKSFVISTLLFGINTSPVPTARSSKSALLDVVVIKLSSINISSNCACCVTSIFCVTVKLPVNPLSPSTYENPGANVPVTVKLLNVLVPFASKLLFTVTLSGM